MIGNRKPHIID